ncbi:SRPBCC family protein [Planococcus lenghuensis]|uniref:Cell division protein n=1 Tax=Planococcus lenghuensis TaxID=2213202 RepID=A0A1Q2KWP4_9BACL|nr:SRPBCC family protein [Planococcus lenghuensis]AQQ52611.1 cell division protein [Planococcus lenghuensis]
MPVIRHEIRIAAPIDVCFDLARNVELFAMASPQPKQWAVAGMTTGLLERGDTVIWESRHLGIRQYISAVITEMEKPVHFTDVMVEGIFRSFITHHEFEEVKGGTRMTTVFSYQSPFGIAGKLADRLFLERYMEQFIIERANGLRRVAEMNESQVMRL